MFPSPIAANKADSFDGGVITDGIHGGCCTMNDIKDAGGKTWGGNL
jgi:hypothetical protein